MEKKLLNSDQSKLSTTQRSMLMCAERTPSINDHDPFRCIFDTVT